MYPLPHFPAKLRLGTDFSKMAKRSVFNHFALFMFKIVSKFWGRCFLFIWPYYSFIKYLIQFSLLTSKIRTINFKKGQIGLFLAILPYSMVADSKCLLTFNFTSLVLSYNFTSYLNCKERAAEIQFQHPESALWIILSQHYELTC